jgi:Lysylphosphatidylglycerol synthase TM region
MKQRTTEWIEKVDLQYHERQFKEPYRSTVALRRMRLAAAVGIHLPLMATVHAVVLVNIAGVLRLVPGNLGVFQAMYTLAVAPYGVSRGPAIAAAALIQSVQLVSAVIAGLFVARSRVLGNSGAPRVIHYLGSIEIRRAWPPLRY